MRKQNIDKKTTKNRHIGRGGSGRRERRSRQRKKKEEERNKEATHEE